jgi:hypothetical protein
VVIVFKKMMLQILQRKEKQKIKDRSMGMVEEYPKVGNSAFEEIGLWLEVSIKDCDKLIVLHISTVHGRFKVACLISCPVCPMPIYDVDPLLMPFRHLPLNEELCLNVI